MNWLPDLRYFRHKIDNQPYSLLYGVVHLAANRKTVRCFCRQNNNFFRDIK